jgi:hypothetical protein
MGMGMGMVMDVLLSRTRRRSVILVALVALLVGLLPTAGAAAATTEPRGTSNVRILRSRAPSMTSPGPRTGTTSCAWPTTASPKTGDGTSYSPRRAVTG